MRLGIVGLPYSGKTALFEAVTGAHRAAAAHDPSAHMATVPVPDERLDFLADLIKPKKVTPAHIDFVDVAGVIADQGREHVAALLAELRNCDGLVHVVRFFEWPSAPPHPLGSLDPERDVGEIHADLIVADLDIAERRIQKLEKQITKPTPIQDHDRRELAVLRKVKDALDQGQPVSQLQLPSSDALMLRPFQFLSQKPLLSVLNVREDKLDDEETRAAARLLGPHTLVISAKIEKEIAELEPEEQAEFLEGLGLGDPAARRLIRTCYSTLGLRSFFTTVSDDLRAWTINAGDTALHAAGKVHSDIARGFIRAGVIAFDDLKAHRTIREVRAKGKERLEGKDYPVQDGDIIHFRFKV